jgi:hypothetical protein
MIGISDIRKEYGGLRTDTHMLVIAPAPCSEKNPFELEDKRTLSRRSFDAEDLWDWLVGQVMHMLARKLDPCVLVAVGWFVVYAVR